MKPMVFLWLLTVACASAESIAFDQVNRLYEEGRYREAIQGYEALALQHPSPAVFFNLGNAYFKSGQIGEAIARYLEAERTSPRDPDVQANLQFARERVTGPSYRAGWLVRKARTFTSGEWATGATVSVWLFFGLLIVRQARPGSRWALRGWTILAGLVAAGLVGSTLWITRIASTHHMAIVTQRETALRFGPFEESQSAATLEDGAELRILDQKDTWLQVTAGKRQIGWVHSSAVRKIQR